jgi:hypothetical protein
VIRLSHSVIGSLEQMMTVLRRALFVVVVGLIVAASACSKDSPAAPTPVPATPTKVIGITGNLAFGTVQIGSSGTATMTIANTGNATLTVTSLNLPSSILSAYGASWTSGTIAAGASQAVTIRFTPTAAIDYNGTLTVAGDQTSGANTIAISGTGAGLVPLAGTVFSSSGSRIGGATIRILDGANAGRTTTSDGTGLYGFTGLTVGNANLSANATGFTQSILGVFIDGRNVLNFTLAAPPFSRSGSGANVFDMPSTVTRVRIIGDYGGSCENFIVRIAGRLIVNEILGSCSVATTGRHFDGTFLTSGGVVEVTSSSGISWSFTQVN